jgi:hypothetical protein
LARRRLRRAVKRRNFCVRAYASGGWMAFYSLPFGLKSKELKHFSLNATTHDASQKESRGFPCGILRFFTTRARCRDHCFSAGFA